jgi:prepilin-type N-terminal cleavage/methylation domain-containing protein
MTRRTPASARPAFTLIELLVVIGIILVLIAIVVVGLRHVNNTAARHETVAEMKICTDVLKEYQSINGLKNIDSDPGAPATIQLPPAWGSSSATGPLSSGSFQLPIFITAPSPTTEAKSGPPAQQSTLNYTDLVVGGAAGGLGDMGDKGGVAGPRWSANAIRWTQAVMYILLKDPKNRALVSAIPPKRILETPPSLTAGTPNPNPFTIDAAVPLDGWGNPIIFVPRGGMHIFMNDPSNPGSPVEYVVRSSGTYKLAALPPLSSNDHPFFASAGQDGFFTDPASSIDYGIDNLYSFQDQ